MSGLGLTMDEFVDLCILCGCDYCERIEGIGCIKAYQLIKEYKTIEKVIEYTDKYNKDDSHKKKLTYNKENFDYVQARELFKKPEVVDTSKVEFNFSSPNVEGLKQFLVKEKNFSETRIDNAIKRLGNAKSKASQSRLDSFFSFKPKTNDNFVNPGKIKPKNISDKNKSNKKKGKK